MLDYGQPSMYMSCLSSPPCAGIDCLIEPLRSTIQAKVKINAVKQEHKKQEELKRSSLRAVAALLAILDSGERSRGWGIGGGGKRRREGRKWRREVSLWRGTGWSSVLSGPSFPLLLL